nr:hypothetical protein Iba_chr12bCG9420 [Ipomoea batatas]
MLLNNFLNGEEKLPVGGGIHGERSANGLNFSELLVFVSDVNALVAEAGNVGEVLRLFPGDFWSWGREWAVGVALKPNVNAINVEDMAAVRNHPQLLPFDDEDVVADQQQAGGENSDNGDGDYRETGVMGVQRRGEYRTGRRRRHGRKAPMTHGSRLIKFVYLVAYKTRTTKA